MNSSWQGKKGIVGSEFEVGSTTEFEFPTSSTSAFVGDAPLRPHAVKSDDLVSLSVTISQLRERRRHFLSPDLFSEPGWEMLLALYRTDAAGHRMTISNLCYASGAPDTTALRWIEKLVELRLVSRKNNPLDARSSFVELEAEGRSAIHAYLEETWSTLNGS